MEKANILNVWYINMLIQILILIVGFLLLVKGADWFVDGAASIARRLGIPQLVIGLTIVAIGTSLPEAAVSITAAMRGNNGITIGNIVGSNILNILIILGITALICNVAIQKSTLCYEIPYMMFITAVLFVMGYTGGVVTFIEGIILLALFVLYFVYLFFLSTRGQHDPDKSSATDNSSVNDNPSDSDTNIKNLPVLKCLLLLLIGGICIISGSDLTVDSACVIARNIGISERFIGLTIVAFGTSLPELVTSVNAARKNNAGIAIGNIVGSNIFNILFIIGVSGLIIPISFERSFLIDTMIAILSGLILLLGTIKQKQLKKPCGIFMLLCYGVYLIYLLL